MDILPRPPLCGQLCRQGHKAWNNIAQTSSRPLPGGHIFCVYTGTHNDHGFLQGGFTEPGGMTVGVNQPVMPYFKGEIHEEAPANGTQFLFEFICRQARPRPDANYPWNVPR